jgi:hypothetical protein
VWTVRARASVAAGRPLQPGCRRLYPATRAATRQLRQTLVQVEPGVNRRKCVRCWTDELQRFVPVRVLLQALRVLHGHSGDINSGSFSPDGKQVVTASRDFTVRVWPLEGTGPPSVLRGHHSSVARAVFSPDGRWIATGSFDKTARLWRIQRDREPVVLEHVGEVTDAVYSYDGHHLLTVTGPQHAVYVWNVSIAAVHDALRRRTKECLSPQQRREYLGQTGAAADQQFRECIGR